MNRQQRKSPSTWVVFGLVSLTLAIGAAAWVVVAKPFDETSTKVGPTPAKAVSDTTTPPKAVGAKTPAVTATVPVTTAPVTPSKTSNIVEEPWKEEIRNVIRENLDAKTFEEVRWYAPLDLGFQTEYRIKFRSQSKFGALEMSDWVITHFEGRYYVDKNSSAKAMFKE